MILEKENKIDIWKARRQYIYIDASRSFEKTDREAGGRELDFHVAYPG